MLTTYCNGRRSDISMVLWLKLPACVCLPCGQVSSIKNKDHTLLSCILWAFHIISVHKYLLNELASSLKLRKAQPSGYYHCSIASPERGGHLFALPRRVGQKTPICAAEKKNRAKLFLSYQNYTLGLRISEIVCKYPFSPRERVLNLIRFSKLSMTPKG